MRDEYNNVERVTRECLPELGHGLTCVLVEHCRSYPTATLQCIVETRNFPESKKQVGKYLFRY